MRTRLSLCLALLAFSQSSGVYAACNEDLLGGKTRFETHWREVGDGLKAFTAAATPEERLLRLSDLETLFKSFDPTAVGNERFTALVGRVLISLPVAISQRAADGSEQSTLLSRMTTVLSPLLSSPKTAGLHAGQVRVLRFYLERGFKFFPSSAAPAVVEGLLSGITPQPASGYDRIFANWVKTAEPEQAAILARLQATVAAAEADQTFGTGDFWIRFARTLAVGVGVPSIFVPGLSAEESSFYLIQYLQVTETSSEAFISGTSEIWKKVRAVGSAPSVALKPALPILVGAIGILFNEKGEKLMLLRSKDDTAFPDTWSFPGGKVDPGETNEQGLVREFFEETGLRVRVVRPLKGIDAEDTKKQKIYRVLPFIVELVDPSQATVVLSSEHSAYAWFDTGSAGPFQGEITEWYVSLGKSD